MPKTETKRTKRNIPVNVYGVNRIKTKKMLARRKKLYDMWKSNKPKEAEVRKAFYSDNPTKPRLAHAFGVCTTRSLVLRAKLRVVECLRPSAFSIL